MSQTLFEKLQLKDEKNLLIQGLPSTIEKQFVKLAFAKNVTPLLRSKKIDFALVFAVNLHQLQTILKEVFPALHEDAKLWIAYPKVASKIASDLNRACTWTCLCDQGYEIVYSVTLDHVWTALRFQRPDPVPVLEHVVAAPAPKVKVAAEVAVAAVAAVASGKRAVALPEDMEHVFTLHPRAKDFFETLSFTNKREYVTWITGAKRDDTRKKRLESTLEKLRAGKKNPTEK
jgi:hypothetical protein